MAKEKPKTIKFEYEILPTYNSYAISGAYGGLTAAGEVVANFFHERGPIPRKQEYQVQDGKLQEPPILEEKKDAIIRDVLFSVSMSPPVARSLANWLNKKADIYETKLLEQKEGASKDDKLQ